MSDAISLQVIVDAQAAVRSMKEAKEATDALVEGFKKLTDVEASLVLETARAQKAVRDAAAEEQRIARYMAEASAKRIEETKALQQATRAAADEAKKTAAENAKLARSSEQLADAIKRAKDETEKLKKANDDAADGLAKSQSKLGLLTTNLGDLGGKIRSISPLWGTMATTAVASFGRITAGVVGVAAGLAHATMELGRHAAEAERTERAERLLGGAFDQVRTATADTVTAQDALRTQQSLLQSGLAVTGDQLATITGRARTFALATGGETPDALNDMMDALRGLEQDGLEKYGIQLQRTGDRQRDFDAAVRQLTSTQTEAQRTAEKWGTSLDRVASASREVQRSVSASQRTMGEDVERTSRSFTAMTNNIALALAKALDLNEVFRFWSDLFDRGANGRRIAADRQRIQGEAAAVERRNTTAALGRMRERGLETRTLEQYLERPDASLDDLARIRAFSQNATTANDGVAQRMMDRLVETLPGVQGMLRDQNREDNAAEARRIKENIAKTRAAGDPLREQRRDFNRALSAAIVIGAPIVTISRTPGQTAQEYWQSRIEAQNASNEMYERAREVGRTEGLQGVEAGRALVSSTDMTELGLMQEEGRRALMARMIEAAGINPENRLRSAASLLGIEGARGEDFGSLMQGIADGQADGGAIARDRRATASRRANRDRETRRQARNESPLGRLGAALGLERDDITGALKPLNALDMGVKGLASTLGVLQSGFAEFFTTVASGAMSAGDAAIVMGAKFLSTLGQMAIQEGAAMLFKSIPAFIEAPPLGAAYLAGGVGLIGLGVGLGAAGAAAMPAKPSAGGGNGASASTDRNGLRSRDSSTARDRSYGDVNVTFSSFVPAGVVDAMNTRNALRRVARAGMDDGARLPRRVEH